jgi:Kinesin motor domain
METSFCEDEGQFAALVQDAIRSSSEDGFSFNTAVALKKNLSETFNQQVSQVDHVARYEHTNPNATMMVAAPTSSTFAKAPSSAFDRAQQTSKRPPIASGYAARKVESFSTKKVAVYLRIRPLPLVLSSKQNRNADDEPRKHDGDGVSTIEVIDPKDGRPPTTIRTYPPSLSNAHKVNINRQGRDSSTYVKEFDFDRVLGPETTQKAVYAAVAAPMIQDLLQAVLQPDAQPGPIKPSPSIDGRESVLLFSYGITNAGKTHTVLGDVNSSNQTSWGLIPRAIADVFDRMRIIASTCSNRQAPPSELFASFFEIYNEQVYDLMPVFPPNSTKSSVFDAPKALKVRECRGQVLVRGLAKHKVNNVEHGIEITKMAHNNRHTSSTNLNSRSSRSHFVCQLQINRREHHFSNGLAPRVQAASTIQDDDSSVASMSGYSTDEEAVVRARDAAGLIWIVDLAGSERSKRTGVGNARQKESTQINKSLMTLMRCLNAINDQGKQGVVSSIVVPFRESKLTHIFVNHLASKSAARTAMMVNVNPSENDFDETQHVLAYATKTRLIEMKPDDYSTKRKQHFGEEYGLDGRKKKQKQEPTQDVATKPESKKQASLFSRMAKKLSPKRVFQNSRMPGSSIKAKETDAFTASFVSSIAAVTGMSESFKETANIEKVKKDLAAAQIELNALRYENARLVEEMSNKENQIRSEVSMEMEERLRETRMKHQQKLESLRSQMQRQTSKTDFTVSFNKAECQLEELLDKVDECEKEIVRMAQEHEKEVESLKTKIQEVQDSMHLAVTQGEQATKRVRDLEKKLEAAQFTIRRLQASDGESADGDSNSQNWNSCEENEGSCRVITASRTAQRASPKKPSPLGKRLRSRKPLHNFTNQRTE